MDFIESEGFTKSTSSLPGTSIYFSRNREEEFRNSNDPKFAHLNDDLHVEITAFAPPSEAHARIAYALTEVRKYLIPDSNDEIRQEQMREMEMINSSLNKKNSSNEGGGAADGGEVPRSSSPGPQHSSSPGGDASSSPSSSSSHHAPSPPTVSPNAYATKTSQQRQHQVEENSCVNINNARSNRLVGGLTSNKGKVLSILEKIRSPQQQLQQFRFQQPQFLQQQHSSEHQQRSLFDAAVSLVRNSGFSYDDLEASGINDGFAKGLKAQSTSSREKYRLQLAPYLSKRN